MCDNDDVDDELSKEIQIRNQIKGEIEGPNQVEDEKLTNEGKEKKYSYGNPIT